MQSFVCCPLWMKTARICDATREQLSIDFVHRFSKFWFFFFFFFFLFFFFLFFSWISIVQLIKFNHNCMHNHLRPNIHVPNKYMYKRKGEDTFSWKNLWNLCTCSSIRQLYCCDITDCSRVPPERVVYKKLIKALKNHCSWLDYLNLPKLLLFDF